MENQEKNLGSSEVKKRSPLFLPVLGLVLDIIPVIVALLLIFTPLRGGTFITNGVLLIGLFISPIIGWVLGIITLCRGKNINSKKEYIIGILDILLPILLVIYVVIVAIGSLSQMTIQM